MKRRIKSAGRAVRVVRAERSVLAALAGGAMMVITGGCAGGGAAAPSSASISKADVEAPVAWTLGPLMSKTLSVNVARVSTYVSGEGKKTMVIKRDPPPNCVCAGRTWAVRRYELDADASVAASIVEAGSVQPVREHNFMVIGGGGIGLVSEINREEKVEVVFDPALMVMPDGLTSFSNGNAQVNQDLAMKVHPLENRSSVKSAGKVMNSIVYVGDQQVKTRAGTFLARRIRSTFSADLSPAKVNNVSEQWFVDGIGLVREIEKETTKVLGVAIRNNTQEWTLAGYAMDAK